MVLREVARRTGVSHNAAYRHFADRDELLAEIASLANDQLEQAMRAGSTGSRRPTRPAGPGRLRATGRAYVEFALAEPGLFNVAFCPTDADERAREEAAPYVLLGQVLDELVESGALSPAGRLGADVVCWSAVHGLSVLLLDGPLRDLVPEERDAVLEKLIATVERGLTGSVA